MIVCLPAHGLELLNAFDRTADANIMTVIRSIDHSSQSRLVLSGQINMAGLSAARL